MAKRKYSDEPAASADSSDVESSQGAEFEVLSTSRGDAESSLRAQYDVFLNFRGPDTRLNFTDCLYHAMNGAGIRVFKDDEEIRKGEVIGGELRRAIKSSAICIPIFSRNYAFSAWCLRELAYMMDCKAMILPIFFDVEPRDVKLKSELYQDSLQKHEEKFGCGVVQRWKDTLKQVARMKGWDLKDTGHGQLIKLIVAEVLIKLNKRDKKLPDHLVGFKERVEDVLHLIDEGSPDVRYLVIHGMGGIGKTTLAKIVFNQIHSQFHGCSFISNVREASKGSQVVQLQKQLLSEILNSNPPEIYDSDVGIYQISTRFRYKKVLIVLDDLDEMEQLSKLAEKPDWFGPGSRIIITTRDINLLPIGEENQENNVQTHFQEFKIYQMRELHHLHSLQLFCKHAFKMDFPPHDYDDISRQIALKADGLPLALEIIGSSLYLQSKRLWKDTLKKLNLVPNPKVSDKLKISFEMLDNAQKDIFCDIACYFIGEKKIYPHYMWKALEFYPKSNIIVLTRKSLIKVDDNDRLLMHDLLRDLGRVIVQQEDKVPGKQSRIWCPKVALEVVQTRRANCDLKVIHLMRCYLSMTPDFSMCSKLRILIFAELCLESTQISSSIDKLEHLKRLEIIGVGVQSSKFFRSPHFDMCIVPSTICRLKCLTHLKLEGQCIQELHPSIGEMAGMTCLSLMHCDQLRKLPDSIGKLRFLLELNLFNTRIRELPDSIADLKKLEKMNLGCTQIRELPNSIGGLESLLDLDLQSTKITELPISIGYLKSLRHLLMANSMIRELPDSMGDLKSLEKMNLHGTQIRELPNSIGGLVSLFHLDLQFTEIAKLPASFGHLKRLKCLRVYGSQIRELPKVIEMLENLENFVYHGRRSIDVTWPPKLLNLCIVCEDPQSLPRLPLSLHSLQLDCFQSPMEQPLLSELKRLPELTLCKWGLREIKFQQLENLKFLSVHRCESLVRLSSLSSIGKLEKRHIYYCSQLIGIHNLGEMESLKELIIQDCNSLLGLPGLPNSLEYLRIMNCRLIERLPNLSKLAKLEILYLSCCESLQDLLGLPNTCRLGVHGCPKLRESCDFLEFCWGCAQSNALRSSRRPPRVHFG